jgi:hypothetical protein
VIIRPSEVHDDWGLAKVGVGLAARALGIECNLTLASQWLVKIDGNERAAFLELAQE